MYKQIFFGGADCFTIFLLIQIHLVAKDSENIGFMW